MKFYILKLLKRKTVKDVVYIYLKVVNERGEIFVLNKHYTEWIGILGNSNNNNNNNIKRLKRRVKSRFDTTIRFEQLGDGLYRSTNPLFYDRLKQEKLDVELQPFYKLYIQDADVYQAGILLSSMYKEIAYYRSTEWLIRIYLDFKNKFKSMERFYHSWFEIDLKVPDLMSSFTHHYENDTQIPFLPVLAFDIETANRYDSDIFPNGFHPDDTVVMISYASNSPAVKDSVHYLLPRKGLRKPPTLPLNKQVELVSYDSELDLILAFFALIKSSKVQILTGYNILNFDLPCLISRLAFYVKATGNQEAARLFSHVKSQKLSNHIVPGFFNKIIVDMYTFILQYSAAGLSNFTLNNVALVRLGGRQKVDISPVSIHMYYLDDTTGNSSNDDDDNILLETDVERVFQAIPRARKKLKKESFGTFPICLEYSYVDSKIVLDLFQKENALPFLISRGNVCGLSIEQSLYFGNSKYLEYVFLSYGTSLGYFIDLTKLRNIDNDGPDCAFMDHAKSRRGKNYQGALNFGHNLTYFENVTNFDFESLYPTVMIVYNVSPDSLSILSADSYFALDQRVKDQCVAVNFCLHDDLDFEKERVIGTKFELPAVSRNGLVIVYSKENRGFLPTVLYNFREKRRQLKSLMKKASKTTEEYHYLDSSQRAIKLVMNSSYGIFGSSETVFANLSLGMTVTFFARMLLLASYHKILSLGYQIAFCDTDSLFVQNKPHDDDDRDVSKEINEYLGHPDVINLVKEKDYRSLIVITKKKYCYETINSKIYSKGFEKKSNAFVQKILTDLLKQVFSSLAACRHDDYYDDSLESRGWCLLSDILQRAFIESRVNPQQNVIDRKVKPIHQYSDRSTAPHLRLLRRLHERPEYQRSLQFTYIHTDVSIEGNRKQNPRLPEECTENIIDFEYLIMSQKKNILSLLNVAFFKRPTMKHIMSEYTKIVRQMKWKTIVNAALLCKFHYKEDLLVCFRTDLKYNNITLK